MQVVYKTGLGMLYQGEAERFNLPVKVDLVLTDPPYFISSEMKISRSKNTTKYRASRDITGDFGEWDKFKSLSDYWKFTFAWVDAADKVLRPGGMFISYFDRDKINFLSYYLRSKGYKTKGYFADCKLNPCPQARRVKWMNGWEEAGLWQKPGGKLTYNYQLGQHKDYTMRPIVSGKERVGHLNQKSERVMLDFIAWWSNEGDTILDLFLGSGTTAVCAERLRRKWVGVEKYTDKCKMAIKRIEEEVKINKSKLF